MPITKIANVITETPMLDKDQFERTGVIRSDEFAICSGKDVLRQIQFDASAITSNTTVTLKMAPQVTSTTIQMTPDEYAAGNTSTALTIDWTNGNSQSCTATGNVTFTLSNPVKGEVYLLKITQDGTGARTYTWPAAVKWSGGTAPTGSGAAKVDLINFYYDGTSYYGASSLNY